MEFNNDCKTCPALPRRPFDCGHCKHKPHGTQYYDLPLWKANDVTSWMVGINGAMIKIDCLFHQFALRTGIDGIPEEIADAVSKLQCSVNALEEWQKVAIKDMAGTTKVVADTLASLDLINEKIRQLNFNYGNLDVRVKSLESGDNDISAQITKLIENIDAVQTEIASIKEADTNTATEIAAMQVKIADLEERLSKLEPPAVTPPSEEP